MDGSPQDRRREYRRHPSGESGTCEGENGPESVLRSGLNDRNGNQARNIRIERLGQVQREEVGKEAGAVWGEAVEVTELVLIAVSVPIQVERMFKPKVRCVSLLS
jgi:hypothetical protein